jgi:hypothetical protein
MLNAARRTPAETVSAPRRLRLLKTIGTTLQPPSPPKVVYPAYSMPAIASHLSDDRAAVRRGRRSAL